MQWEARCIGTSWNGRLTFGFFGDAANQLLLANDANLAEVLPNAPSEAFFLTAARTLASLVSDQDLDAGSLYPRLRDIRQVSLAIATKVAEQAHALGLARRARPLDIEGYVYDP